MRRIVYLVLCTASFTYGDDLESFLEIKEELVEKEIADAQSPDMYDKPYNLNPVPINPRTPEPASWKDAYNRLCESIKSIETRLDLLQSRVRTLEDQSDTAQNTSSE